MDLIYLFLLYVITAVLDEFAVEGCGGKKRGGPEIVGWRLFRQNLAGHACLSQINLGWARTCQSLYAGSGPWALVGLWIISSFIDFVTFISSLCLFAHKKNSLCLF
jgi:hypothetical protein